MAKMKTPKFTPIAMRCNQEQFDKIKPKLKKSELVLGSCILNESWPYLINHYHDDDLDINKPSIGSYVATRNAKEIYEEWDENIFLEACGIEVKESKEKTYKITREQIKEVYGYCNSTELQNTVKEWFPSVFKEEKNELPRDFTGWVLDEKYPKVIAYSENGFLKYGFDSNGKWVESSNTKLLNERVATAQEVEEALVKEAIKLYLTPNNLKYIDCLNLWSTQRSYEIFETIGNFCYEESSNKLWIENGANLSICIFDNGKWAKLNYMTHSEAEAKLNCKII